MAILGSPHSPGPTPISVSDLDRLPAGIIRISPQHLQDVHYLEELEAQRIELLPDREEMQNFNIGAAAAAVQGAQAGFGQATRGPSANGSM
jgi:hypothetical protein